MDIGYIYGQIVGLLFHIYVPISLQYCLVFLTFSRISSPSQSALYQFPALVFTAQRKLELMSTSCFSIGAGLARISYQNARI